MAKHTGLKAKYYVTVVDRIKNGESAYKIAKDLNIAPANIYNWVHDLNLKKKPTKTEQIIKLYNEGETYKNIAKAVDTSEKTVANILYTERKKNPELLTRKTSEVYRQGGAKTAKKTIYNKLAEQFKYHAEKIEELRTAMNLINEIEV